MATTRPESILLAPGAWKAKCTAHMIGFWTDKKTAQALPAKTYSPLEAQSPYASKEFGEPLGGLGFIQLIRYTETPVGPYDELILAPGLFAYPFEDKDGKKTTKTARRITRIYVSQKHTCWNGRTNWNIPKHLARFEWTENQDGSTHIKVFPHDEPGPGQPYDATEARPCASPFFQCTIKPMKYLPSFPLSTNVMKLTGINMAMVHPPVPQGAGSAGELAGTDRWCEIDDFVQSSRAAHLSWVDMSQKGEDGKAPDEFDNFWPGMGRWVMAVTLADGDLALGAGKHWDTPKSLV
ncbi:hypothetical protein B0T19DRAFT_407734 [Cercophora scortea]|uniref:Uncharacterized protein n=1 Tax=Cercophora scortea TaxID=314031 RepID=A0AAE0J3I6_9PEZI|nr:hypothetical protein B0T19DRAFT_407734 [Cercophora scortea]